MRLLCIVFFLLSPTLLSAQELYFKDGVDITVEGDLKVAFDNFTGETFITIDSPSEYDGITTVPLYTEEEGLFGYFNRWVLLFYLEESNFLTIEDGNHVFPLLADDKRIMVSTELYTEQDEESDYQVLAFKLLESEWDDIRLAENVRYRVEGKARKISSVTLNHMTKISNKVSEIESASESENTTQDSVKKSSPYELSWEGEINRSPMVQPLPNNPNNSESVITVRFEVRPDGTVGRIIPLRKMNPELEREVMSTLRSWRFSRLPGGVPQQTQWGTITFRFVID